VEKRSFAEVVSTVRNARDQGRHCSLLIGAGVSVTANIPLARGFVELIEKRFPEQFQRAAKRSYPDCMAELAIGDRRDLIAEFVDKAKINWAHMAIAQLMADGYVDRVLTTNFDPLVSRACAMVGQFPAIYDFAASQEFKPHYLSRQQAVFHLHGQRTGFALFHTEEEVSRHKNAIAPLFKDAGEGRVWIVVGYSGESDPVVQHLSAVETFEHNLYWIGYKDNEPAKYVQENLLTPGRYAWWVDGHDADSFFVSLARDLKCFPPDLISRPIHHLEKQLDVLSEFTLPGQSTSTDVMMETRQVLKRCREFLAAEEGSPTEGPSETNKTRESESQTESPSLQAIKLFMAGDYEKVVSLFPAGTDIDEEGRDAVSWSWVMLGSALSAQAKQKQGEEADNLFRLAGEKYAEALRIKPDKHEALNNWGSALSGQAKQKQGEEADNLFRLAGEKYAEALRIKPDKHEALNNWGSALSDQVKQKQGEEADNLFRLAGEKYAEALRIKPDKHEALNNWGNALSDQAKQKQGEEADMLHSAAADLFNQTEQIAPGAAAYNLACLEALRGHPNQVLDWLVRSRDAGELPPKKFVLEDPDLKSVRRRKWFQDFVKSLP